MAFIYVYALRRPVAMAAVAPTLNSSHLALVARCPLADGCADPVVICDGGCDQVGANCRGKLHVRAAQPRGSCQPGLCGCASRCPFSRMAACYLRHPGNRL